MLTSHELSQAARKQRVARRTTITTLLGIPVLVAAALSARPDPLDNVLETRAGTPVPVGEGTARVYMTVSGERPVELGVELTEAALRGLPHPATGASPEEMHFGWVLKMPDANPTPFETVSLNWNPHGHEPLGVYDRPHFDFHFYTITETQVDEISPRNPDFQKLGETLPTPEFVPVRYIAPELLVMPRMGLHWIDREAPEINGKEFSSTFIYGSWNGNFIFVEPMITKMLIESKSEFYAEVPTAERYATAGYHPSSYRVYFEADTRTHRIALTSFVYKG